MTTTAPKVKKAARKAEQRTLTFDRGHFRPS